MKYLLDTCVISELIKKEPESRVVKWIEAVEETSLYLSVITLGEIQRGISKLGNSKKAQSLSEWLHHDLLERFEGRIFLLDNQVGLAWGKLLGETERKGRNVPVIDAFLGAIALVHELTLVTRNIKHVQELGFSLLNPWEE